MNTQENNKMIAEFMGMEKERHADGRYLFTTDIDELKGADTRFWEELYFHVSWDWLMPVVEKIFSLGYDYTIKPRHMIIKERMGEIVSECIGQYQSQEEVIYQAVVEFINKLNK
jgi:hypothetical protein